jgi:predicted transcriptional regulator of viral defense system
VIAYNQDIIGPNGHTLIPSTLRSRLYNRKKRGLIANVRKGFYIPADMQNKYRIACYVVQDGCIAYHSALEYYVLHTQVFNWLYVHGSKTFRSFTYQGEQYIYKPLKFILNPLIDNKDPQYPIKVTSLSQTIIDCIYNISLAGGIEELLYALRWIEPGKLSEREMMECLLQYNKKSLYQRTGYLLSLFKESLNISDQFLKMCSAKIGNTTSYLITPQFCNAYVKEWKLCVPDNLMSYIQKGVYDEEFV